MMWTASFTSEAQRDSHHIQFVEKSCISFRGQKPIPVGGPSPDSWDTELASVIGQLVRWEEMKLCKSNV